MPAVPNEYCDEASLVGPCSASEMRYKAWEGSGATGLTLACKQVEGLQLMAGCREATIGLSRPALIAEA
jgi:hypothetical protein